MATTSDPNDDKMADVTKPGKSTPDATSRPVITTHGPLVQDPMMKTENAIPADAPEEETKAATHGSKVIKPLDDTAQPEAEAPAKSPAPVESSDTAVVDAVVDQAAVDKKKENTADDADKAKQAAIAKLIEEKKYFVKVGQMARRRNNRIALILIVLVLILVGAYVALDAGVIKAPFDVPVHLIKK